MAAMRKVRAFTLLEVMVAMVISGIVLAMAMSAFIIIQRQFDNFRERGGEIFQVQRTRSLMAKDMADATLVLGAGASVALRMPDGEELMYHFRAGVLTRERAGRIDTLATGITVPELETVPNIGANPPVAQLSFTMESGKKTYPLVFYKTYSPADLINLE